MRVLLDSTFAQRAARSGTAVYLERLTWALGELGGIDLIEVHNRGRRPPAGGGPAAGNAWSISGGRGASCPGWRQLYCQALALVHPALYEGFGMTPLEAMTLGTPVIAADAPAIAEGQTAAAQFSWIASARRHVEAYSLAGSR